MKRILDAKFHCSKTPSYFLVIFILRFCKNSYLFWWCLKWIESKTKRNSTWWEKFPGCQEHHISRRNWFLYICQSYSENKVMTNHWLTLYVYMSHFYAWDQGGCLVLCFTVWLVWKYFNRLCNKQTKLKPFNLSKQFSYQCLAHVIYKLLCIFSLIECGYISWYLMIPLGIFH